MGLPYSHISPEEAKANSLEFVRLKHNQLWDNIPYSETIYKMIDNVIEYQLDRISTPELEEFFLEHMQRFYEDKRNAVEFNDAWMAYKEGRDGKSI
jgi:hypothetical protein